MAKSKPLTLEERQAREKRRFERTLGKEITGATSMLVTLRYLMDGGYPFFGHHGGAIVLFDDALYTDRDFNRWYVHVPHEQIAGHAAEGFADSTGKVGVAVVTSGPAITNLTTPCYDAWMDSVPVVYIAGNVPQSLAGSMAFQEAPVSSIFDNISKKVFYITNAEEIPHVLFEAFRLAKSGRPGPVVVDVPKDVQLQRAKFNLDLESIVDRENSFDTTSWTELSKRIASAKKPVLYVGRGVISAEAWEELRQLVEKTGIPVAYTLKGKGVFPDTHQLCLGPLGMHGSVTANYAVNDADLLIVVGARFDDRVIGNPELFAPNAYIAHLDIDPKGIGPEKRQPDMVVKGNAKDSLKALNDLVETSYPKLRNWHAQIDNWKQKFPFGYYQERGIIKPQFVLQTLSEILEDKKDNVIYVTDVGMHQMWAMQYLNTSNPRGFLSSGGAGTMGYGLPVALGAKLGNPNKTVVLVTGDASFRMTPQTLELYSQLRADIKVMVIDNSSPESPSGGMVKYWLERGAHPNARLKIKGELSDIASIATGYGVAASNVEGPMGISVYHSITSALEREGPQLLNFKVDPTERVYPIIPPGGSVKDIQLGPGK